MSNLLYFQMPQKYEDNFLGSFFPHFFEFMKENFLIKPKHKTFCNFK